MGNKQLGGGGGEGYYEPGCTPSIFRPAPLTREQLQREVEKAQRTLVERKKDLEFAKQETTKRIEEKSKSLQENLQEYARTGRKNVLLKQDITYALFMRKEYIHSRQKTIDKIVVIERQEQAMMEQNLQSLTYDALKTNLIVMRNIQSQVSPDQVQELMDDVQESNAFAQESMDILSRPMATGMNWDDEDLLAEVEDEMRLLEETQDQTPIEGSGKHTVVTTINTTKATQNDPLYA